MTVDERPISDDDLHAFVDGLLDSERQEEVQGYLAERPEVAARVPLGRRTARHYAKPASGS
jgi:anti-sigma factor RsiW